MYEIPVTNHAYYRNGVSFSQIRGVSLIVRGVSFHYPFKMEVSYELENILVVFFHSPCC